MNTQLVWKSPKAGQPADLPATLLERLLDRGSLTLRVRAYCQQQAQPFSLRLLEQRWVKPSREEAKTLGINPRQAVLSRNIQLCCGDEVVIFAHTIVPRSSLRGRSRYLGRLGTRPLGAALFSDPSMRRSRISMARLKPNHSLYASAIKHSRQSPQCIYGRRSCFYIAGKPLLVAEFFLPGAFIGASTKR